jgi:hypothetical protein
MALIQFDKCDEIPAISKLSRAITQFNAEYSFFWNNYKYTMFLPKESRVFNKDAACLTRYVRSSMISIINLGNEIVRFKDEEAIPKMSPLFKERLRDFCVTCDQTPPDWLS